MPEQPPRIILVPPGFRTTIDPESPSGWEAHPDEKGGVRPALEHRRGSVNIPCSECGRPLVREASAAIVKSSTFGCPEPCGARFIGETIAGNVL